MSDLTESIKALGEKTEGVSDSIKNLPEQISATLNKSIGSNIKKALEEGKLLTALNKLPDTLSQAIDKSTLTTKLTEFSAELNGQQQQTELYYSQLQEVVEDNKKLLTITESSLKKSDETAAALKQLAANDTTRLQMEKEKAKAAGTEKKDEAAAQLPVTEGNKGDTLNQRRAEFARNAQASRLDLKIKEFEQSDEGKAYLAKKAEAENVGKQFNFNEMDMFDRGPLGNLLVSLGKGNVFGDVLKKQTMEEFAKNNKDEKAKEYEKNKAAKEALEKKTEKDKEAEQLKELGLTPDEAEKLIAGEVKPENILSKTASDVEKKNKEKTIFEKDREEKLKEEAAQAKVKEEEKEEGIEEDEEGNEVNEDITKTIKVDIVDIDDDLIVKIGKILKDILSSEPEETENEAEASTGEVAPVEKELAPGVEKVINKKGVTQYRDKSSKKFVSKETAYKTEKEEEEKEAPEQKPVVAETLPTSEPKPVTPSAAADVAKAGKSGSGLSSFVEGFGGLFETIGGLFLADGGDIDANQPAIVGERGPELFTPASKGSITSNSNLKNSEIRGYSRGKVTGDSPTQRPANGITNNTTNNVGGESATENIANSNTNVTAVHSTALETISKTETIKESSSDMLKTINQSLQEISNKLSNNNTSTANNSNSSISNSNTIGSAQSTTINVQATGNPITNSRLKTDNMMYNRRAAT